MRVLFLAPQPFYQERGTPIAVRLALEALSKRLDGNPDCGIDVLTYGEGDDIPIEGVQIHRIPTPRYLTGIRPGISFRKLLCDTIFFASTLSMLWRARHNQYRVVHAVEESVFIAWFAKHLFGVPYIYDMDSSLALQLTEKWWWCKPLLPMLRALERLAVRGSIAVAPVCDALEALANQYGSRSTVLLRDVSLLPGTGDHQDGSVDVRAELRAENDQPIFMYIGNLETYQGIDLLLESFARIAQHAARPLLVIVGGTPSSIASYREKAAALNCSSNVIFMGPRPVAHLCTYLDAADILVSPRTRGNNTPMKIYSYLHSGRPVLATDLSTHRQVLDNEIAILSAPSPGPFSESMLRLLEDSTLRKELGSRARERAEHLYTVEAFERQIAALYDRIDQEILCKPVNPSANAVVEETV